MVSVFIICAVLSVLEISLSFDNAIVNARILRDMSPKWQHRFLTWGIVIAVFGMRIVFPLAIVAIAMWTDPISALKLAIWQPNEYARVIAGSHTGIAAFGGTFLLMVGMKYFFDVEKDVHWIRMIESRMSKFASVQGVEIGVAIALIIFFSYQLDADHSHTFVIAGLFGLLTFLAVEGLGEVLDATQEQMDMVHRGGLGAFIYLEVLDASFSFDGVIGAFALTTNLFVIAIGLGIGVFMCARSRSCWWSARRLASTGIWSTVRFTLSSCWRSSCMYRRWCIYRKLLPASSARHLSASPSCRRCAITA